MIPRKAWIGLGANLGEPAVQVEAAIQSLAAVPGIGLLHRSSFYRSTPLGPLGQPDYCNAVCAIDTTLAPHELLARMQAIEHAAGRTRGGPRWSARTLDLDLLHVDGVVSDDPALTLPHPELHRRAFVLVPLAEIAPDLDLPGLGRVSGLAAAIDRTGLSRWDR